MGSDKNEKFFFDAIGRPDLKDKNTSLSPWTYFSMEIGLPNFSFAGGLGILAGDIYLQAGKLEVPFVAVTLFYPTIWRQHLNDFTITEEYGDINPEYLNFKKETEFIFLANNDTVHIDVLCKEMNKTKIIALYDSGLRDLYHGESNSEHRFYQNVMLGFGGYIAVRKMGFKPSIIHLNESTTVFSAIAYLDELCANGIRFDEALVEVRSKTILTNHTLVPAAIAHFPKEFFEKYVYKNLKTDVVKNWINGFFEKQNQPLRLTLFALELAGKLNGVSKMHARISSETFSKIDGSKVKFHPITNGIYMQRWIYRELYRFYREKGIVDDYDLPVEEYRGKIENIETEKIYEIKEKAKTDILRYLRVRKDQYNNPVHIPQGVKIVCWARRFAGYKRPTMMFYDEKRLLQILEDKNMHFVVSGDVNLTGNNDMREEVRHVLSKINENKKLSERVHFVQDYDQTLSKYLVCGSDVWLNTPVVGNEACGTSWMKAVGNLGILISTSDGGVADDGSDSYLKIKGASYEEEVDSLYKTLEKAGDILNDKNTWSGFVKKQLQACLPIISGGRMMKEYLEFVFQ